MKNIQLSRIDKLFVDRDRTDAGVSSARRREFSVALHCGNDLATSYTMQVAVLTAAQILIRCFPGAVRVVVGEGFSSVPLLIWRALPLKLIDAIAEIVGINALTDRDDNPAQTLVFGDANPPTGALRVTFDGWIAKVGPASCTDRLPERDYCPLAGVLAASIGASELFLSFAGLSVEARRRQVAVSLWEPDADATAPASIGVPVEFLPSELWVLGLGHLGNAYLWSLGMLPYPDFTDLRVFLNDFDKVESENVETGLLFAAPDVGALKTRTCARWLERLGVEARLIERHFDDSFRCRPDEPAVALCGFDSNPVRRSLSTAGFRWLFESGLGGTPGNFDTVSLHVLPNSRTAESLWPDPSQAQQALQIKERERAIRENSAYLGLAADECGRFELAGKSIAVPFVGAAAASFVLAEMLKLFHDGPSYTDIKFSLCVPRRLSAIGSGKYKAHDSRGIRHIAVKRPR